MIHLEISFNSVNTSIQAGDLVFYVPSSVIKTGGGFEYSNDSILLFGTVVEINGNTITVLYDNINNPNPPPSSGDYLMFAKNLKLNSGDIKGYYLKANFVNNSREAAELFAVGSEVVESSK